MEVFEFIGSLNSNYASEDDFQGLEDAQVQALWSLTTNKHEADLRIIYQVICDLAKTMSLRNLNLTYSLILSVPIDRYEEQTIVLIRQFTLNAMSNLRQSKGVGYFGMKKQQKRNNSEKYEFFGFRHLFELAMDSSKLSVPLSRLARESFEELILNKEGLFSSERENIITLVFERLQRQESVPQVLFVLRTILGTYSSNKSMWNSEQVREEIIAKFCVRDNNLLELIITGFETYLQRVPKGLPAEGLGQKVFHGKVDHQTNIEIRLEILETIIPFLRKGQEISIDNIKQLWSRLVLQNTTPLEKTIFLDWLKKYRESLKDLGYGRTPKKVINFILGQDLIKEVIKILFADPKLMNDYAQTDLQTYECIECIFMGYNQRIESFEKNSKQLIKVIKQPEIVGAEILWNIVIRCQI